MKPTVEIEYCIGCRWLLRATWTAQELLTTFEDELGGVNLRPSAKSGCYEISVDGNLLWSREKNSGFPEMKELKQKIRDHVAPERDLGHSDIKQQDCEAK